MRRDNSKNVQDTTLETNSNPNPNPNPNSDPTRNSILHAWPESMRKPEFPRGEETSKDSWRTSYHLTIDTSTIPCISGYFSSVLLQVLILEIQLLSLIASYVVPVPGYVCLNNRVLGEGNGLYLVYVKKSRLQRVRRGTSLKNPPSRRSTLLCVFEHMNTCLYEVLACLSQQQ